MNESAHMTGENEYPTITLEEICDIIEDAPKALIISHVNPDGDTVGSAFALKEMICAAGGTARCICPGDVPRRLRFLMTDQDDMSFDRESAVLPDDYDIICAVDVASPMQLGAFEPMIPYIDFMIDHHGVGTPFAPHYIDAEASACGEILYDIYANLANRGIYETCPDAARRIYAAIVSDTGSFKFSNTTPKTHMIAAALVDVINTAKDEGMDTADLCRSLFGQRTLKELTAQMIAIQNLRFYDSGRLGVVLFTQQMLADAGLTEEEIGNVVDTPRGVEGVVVGLSLRQLAADPTQYKVSARANGNIDVSAVCAGFGGGGHVRAAGCTVTADTPEDALDMVVEAFLSALADAEMPDTLA
ncbi:MAG: bifunctional oligoribonuclease/PAP phosphatase NrnA [Clostridia bacterium]|nr:bifunctional oligoribonuclease/PAP phosphatase NrnA [Clostridia bacterium]